MRNYTGAPSPSAARVPRAPEPLPYLIVSPKCASLTTLATVIRRRVCVSRPGVATASPPPTALVAVYGALRGHRHASRRLYRQTPPCPACENLRLFLSFVFLQILLFLTPSFFFYLFHLLFFPSTSSPSPSCSSLFVFSSPPPSSFTSASSPPPPFHLPLLPDPLTRT